MLLLIVITLVGCSNSKNNMMTMDDIKSQISESLKEDKNRVVENEVEGLNTKFYVGEKCNYNFVTNDKYKINAFYVLKKDGIVKVGDTDNYCSEVGKRIFMNLFPENKDKINKLKQGDTIKIVEKNIKYDIEYSEIAVAFAIK